MPFEYFNTLLFTILVAINWGLHFLINNQKRRKKGEIYLLNLKTIISECLSFFIVLLISFLEGVFILYIYALLTR